VLEKPLTSSSLLVDESVETLGLEIRRFFLQQSTFDHIGMIGEIGDCRDTYRQSSWLLRSSPSCNTLKRGSKGIPSYEPAHCGRYLGKAFGWVRSEITEGGEVTL